ncbi:uncharacterized protein LOC143183816 [Calliopsis andreniformis]|uniref:uncharacterized protein LOC143183816 n=1 Tax=Calliopsis andreniformis TaxID=337506 RepID=UPI003FCC7477
MGQVIGRVPYTWGVLLEEKDRVLYWSGEVLSKVADNVNQEESLWIDYSNEVIDEKVEAWIEANRARIENIFSKHINVPQEFIVQVLNAIAQIKEKFRLKMRNDYRRGYADLGKFTRKVDQLGKQQRKIHGKIQELEDVCAGDIKKFRKKFGRLRLKTFTNLKIGEQMMLLDKQLKAKFVKQVHTIDYKNKKECAKDFDKLINAIMRAGLEE